jgi:hypothetical protein
MGFFYWYNGMFPTKKLAGGVQPLDDDPLRPLVTQHFSTACFRKMWF